MVCWLSGREGLHNFNYAMENKVINIIILIYLVTRFNTQGPCTSSDGNVSVLVNDAIPTKNYYLVLKYQTSRNIPV